MPAKAAGPNAMHISFENAPDGMQNIFFALYLRSGSGRTRTDGIRELLHKHNLEFVEHGPYPSDEKGLTSEGEYAVSIGFGPLHTVKSAGKGSVAFNILGIKKPSPSTNGAIDTKDTIANTHKLEKGPLA